MQARTTLPLVTDAQGRVETILTDIIGERDVTIEAKLPQYPATPAAQRSISTGPGPLSLFASAPGKPVSWLELYKECNGAPYPGDPLQWKTSEEFAGGEKMPTLAQLQAISLPGHYNRQANACGAALAAGWPDDHRYWNGRPVMKARASHASLRDGNYHGSGGNDIGAKEYGVCLK